MRSRFLFWASVSGVVSLGALYWAVGSRAEEESTEQVRRLVVEMTNAAQAQDVASLMKPVSEHFKSADGMDKRELKQWVAYHVLRGRWVRVFTSELKLSERSPTSVEVSGKFVLGRSEATRLKDLAQESEISTYQIDARAEKESDGTWRFIWARHQEVDPRTLLQ